MGRIRKVDGGFRLESGRYAVVAQDWSGDVADPRPDAGERLALALPHADEPTLVEYEGMTALILPIGRDSGGAPGRSVAIGTDTLVAFGRIVIVDAGDEVHRRPNRHASHVDEVAILDVTDGLLVSACDGGYDFDGLDGGDNHEGIDARTPGAFFIEGEMFDMTDEATAKAFDYGSEAFNAKLDEHGFFADLAAVRRRIAEEMDGPHAVMVANRLRGLGETAYAYYAPVMA